METLSKNKIKWIRSLRMKKNRDAEQLFVVEGEKMVKELITHHGQQIEFIVSTDEGFQFSGDAFFASHKMMQQISSLKTPNQLLAVVKMNQPKTNESKFILALDGIQDPGNMGTILRTADWFDVDKIVCSHNTVDIYNPKVVQSSMGSIFRMPTQYCNLEEYLRSTSLPIYGALLSGENIYEKKLRKEGIIVMGNEGYGISDEIQEFIRFSLHIPRFGASESLNVAVATAVILSEFSRS